MGCYVTGWGREGTDCRRDDGEDQLARRRKGKWGGIVDCDCISWDGKY